MASKIIISAVAALAAASAVSAQTAWGQVCFFAACPESLLINWYSVVVRAGQAQRHALPDMLAPTRMITTRRLEILSNNSLYYLVLMLL